MGFFARPREAVGEMRLLPGTDVQYAGPLAAERALETVLSGAVALGVALALWPPGRVYWTALADRVGDAPTLVLVSVLAFGLGTWFVRTSGVSLEHVLAGTVLGYAVGMVAIAVVIEPDSPAHLALYAGLFGAVLAGGGLWTAVRRRATPAAADTSGWI
jgi:hypothetical protein